MPNNNFRTVICYCLLRHYFRSRSLSFLVKQDYLRRMKVFAGGLSPATSGPLLILSGSEICENVRLATNYVAGGKQVL